MRVNVRDTAGGLIIIALSAAFLYASFDYQIGTTRRLGPGYFPMLVSSIGVLLGAALIIAGLRIEAPRPEIAWRPVLSVTSALIVFGLTIQSLGLVPATLLLVVISALGNAENKPPTVAVLGVIAAIMAWLIFIVGLAVPVPAFAGVLSWI